jgi:hypothetical protein
MQKRQSLPLALCPVVASGLVAVSASSRNAAFHGDR